MENKEYYTPEIDELHVGYECQLQNIENAVWGKYIIKEGDRFSEDIEIETIRTKYLDKEDIESLGWRFVGGGLIYPYRERFTIDDFFFLEFCHLKDEGYKPLVNIYTIINGKIDCTDFGYHGECKSINELRVIFKLLDIAE